MGRASKVAPFKKTAVIFRQIFLVSLCINEPSTAGKKLQESRLHMLYFPVSLRLPALQQIDLLGSS